MVLKYYHTKRSEMIDDPVNDNYRYHAYRLIFVASPV